MADSPTENSRPALRVLRFARPYAWIVAIVIAFSLLYGGGLTWRAFIVRNLVDDVALKNARVESMTDILKRPKLEAANPEKLRRERRELKAKVRENLWSLALEALALMLLMPLVRAVRDYASEWVMTRLVVDMQQSLMDKMLRMPLGRHQRETRGDAVARITSDVAVANRFQSQIFGDVLEDAGVVIAALVGAGMLCWQLALSLWVVGPPIGLVLAVFGARIRKASRRRQEQVSEVMQRNVQILSGMKVIKAFGAEAVEVNAYRDDNMRYFRRALKVVKNRVYSRSIVEAVTQAGILVVTILGIWAVVGEFWGLTLGTLLAFLFVTGSLYRPMKALTQLWNLVHEAAPSAERIFEVLDTDEEPLDAPGARPITHLAEGIRFRDVVFHYGREEVLKGVNLEIPAGKTVALVGPTGSGKTTLADLVLRFHDPESGAIEFDGVDARKLQRKSLRAMCAVVTQEPFLFDTSILENIRYGRPDASEKEVKDAARAANAHDFIEKLPQGYQTPVGELGSQLSGGQRQRITVARAILRDPQVLILDEPTSALDAISEQAVQEAIARLMQHRTVLVIAHRLSTVQSADVIAVLEDGVISTTGTHDELASRGGLYQKLVRLQLSPAS